MGLSTARLSYLDGLCGLIVITRPALTATSSIEEEDRLRDSRLLSGWCSNPLLYLRGELHILWVSARHSSRHHGFHPTALITCRMVLLVLKPPRFSSNKTSSWMNSVTKNHIQGPAPNQSAYRRRDKRTSTRSKKPRRIVPFATNG
jgi:hypothetical protein